MLIHTKGSNLVYDDAKLGKPITLTPVQIAFVRLARFRRHLCFFVDANDIRCLESNQTAKSFDALVALALGSLVLNERPPAPSPAATYRTFFNSPLILMEFAFVPHRGRRIFISIRGNLNYAKVI